MNDNRVMALRPFPVTWRRLVIAAGSGLALLGLAVLIGWSALPADFAVGLTRWFPPSPQSGLCWILLGLGIAGAASGYGPGPGRIAGLAVLLFAGDRLLDWISLPSLHLDRLLGFAWFERSRATGRMMSPLSAAGLTALGAALAIRPVPLPGTRRDTLAGALALLAIFALLPTIAGRMHGSAFLYGGLIGHVSVPATIGMLFAAGALIALGGPGGFPARLLVGQASRSVLLRVFVPLAIVAVFLDAAIRIMFLPRLGITRAPVESVEAFMTLVEAVVAALAAAHLVGTAADGSAAAHQRALAALDVERERLQLVLDTVPVGVVVADAAGRLSMVNREAERIIGAGPHDAAPHQWPDRYGIHLPDGRGLAPAETIPLVRALQGETVDAIDALIKPFMSAEGIQVITSARPLRDEAGAVRGAVMIFADVNARRMLERRARESQRLEAIGQMAGGVAHDFNNLLTVILGHSELLLDRMDPADPHRKPVARIDASARRAATLTRHLLAFSRRQTLQPRPLDLGAFLDELAGPLQEAAGPDLRLEILPAAEPATAIVDPDRLSEALVSVLLNSREAATGPGTVQVALETGSWPTPLRVGGDMLPPGAYARLAIRDDGPGMPAAVLARVLEPFFTTKPKHLGAGLGLSTVYGFARQSGGGLTVESTPGHGTSVILWLPLTTPAADTRAAGVRPGPAAASGSRTLLLAEDEHEIRELAAEFLEASGWTVVRAADGLAALEAAAGREHDIALLVTDVMMPNLGGVELARRLRERTPGLRVLFMSGFTDTAPLGDAPFLPKPFSPAALLDAVTRAAG